jgi:hypothetical protein
LRKVFRFLFRDACSEVDAREGQILFVAGLPKSGTSWLERMLAEIPGYSSFLPPHTTIQDHNLRDTTFEAVRGRRVAIKMHTRGTRENISILKRNMIKYCIMYRDLRDVAVSWYFYLRNIALDHPLHDIVKEMNVDEGIDYFLENDNDSDSLILYMQWLQNWFNNRDYCNSILVRYEDLIEDTYGELARLLNFYEIKLDENEINAIVKKHEFRNTTGRVPGEHDVASFNRKGIVGDWHNYFTTEHKEKFKRIAGQFLIETGYERDVNW